jgi:hypothetical protein
MAPLIMLAATVAEKFGMSRKHRKSSYTIIRCGHAASRIGSSSSGSYSAPSGLRRGGSA